MSDPCSSAGPSRRSTTRTRLGELVSWRSLKRNPSGALLWGIVGGATLAVSGYCWSNFLMRKEYQVDRKRRMWNERFEMLENPSRMKMYYPTEGSVPKPCQPLMDVYVKMREAEIVRCQKIQAYARAIDAERYAS